MTPDNVVARAIELCKFEIKASKEAIRIATNNKINATDSDVRYWDLNIERQKQSLKSWQTHLDEFGGHKRISLKTINVKVPEVGKIFDYERTCACGSVIIESECPIAELKAKRLLGEE